MATERLNKLEALMRPAASRSKMLYHHKSPRSKQSLVHPNPQGGKTLIQIKSLDSSPRKSFLYRSPPVLPLPRTQESPPLAPPSLGPRRPGFQLQLKSQLSFFPFKSQKKRHRMTFLLTFIHSSKQQRRPATPLIRPFMVLHLSGHKSLHHYAEMQETWLG
ncbi:hypothetical protein HJG60_009022 [Phyllostomus discolor]|uniref:Uncharacterized protein n=1 Tax=Phyllostomus discolor TaxID=89673 RepID=A0A834DCP0_9CHIR|nr:hypothetical protein HJG60_009022 [Phyllostomus discolor]